MSRPSSTAKCAVVGRVVDQPREHLRRDPAQRLLAGVGRAELERRGPQAVAALLGQVHDEALVAQDTEQVVGRRAREPEVAGDRRAPAAAPTRRPSRVRTSSAWPAAGTFAMASSVSDDRQCPAPRRDTSARARVECPAMDATQPVTRRRRRADDRRRRRRRPRRRPGRARPGRARRDRARRARSSTRSPRRRARTTASRPASARSPPRHIPPERRTELQRSLIRSHAAGSGPEVEREVVRALMLLRLSTLATGRTGVRPATAETLRGAAVRRHHAGRPRARLARLLGRPRAARPLRAGADGRGAGARRGRRACAPPPTRWPTPGSRRSCSPRRRASRSSTARTGCSACSCSRSPTCARCCATADITAAMSVEGLLGTDARLRRRPARAAPAPRPGGVARRTCARCSPAARSSPATAARRTRASRTPTRCAARPRSPAPRATRSTTPPRSPRASSPRRSTTRSSPLDGRVESNGNFHGAPLAYVLRLPRDRRRRRREHRRAAHGPLPRRRRAATACRRSWPTTPASTPGYMIAQYTQAGARLRAQAARRARVASTRSRARRCRRTTSRWAGRPRASCAAPSTRLDARAGRSSCSRAAPRHRAARPARARAAATGAVDRRPARARSPAPGPDRVPRAGPIEPRPVASSLAARGAIRARGRPDRVTGAAAMRRRRIDRTCAAAAGSRRRRCGCSRTTSIPTSPSSPEELVVYGGIGKAARDQASLRDDQARADAPRRRRDAARPVGQAGRGVRDPRAARRAC